MTCPSRIVSAAFAASCVATIVLASTAHAAGRAGDDAAVQPLAAEIATIAIARIAEVRELVGTARARNTATVAAQIFGTIVEVNVRAGETVRAGQAMARLEDRALAAEYQRAEADRRRYQALLEKAAATRAEYEAVLARYRVAEAALSHARVTAPMDGIVAKRLVDPGDMAEPGKPLFVVEQGGAFRFETEVPERIGTSIKEGDLVHVHIDSSGEDCAGTVAELVPAADPVTRGFAAKIDLDCRQPLRSGAFGRVRLEVEGREAVVVPARALHQTGQLTYVFVEESGHARMRLVRTGLSREDGTVEILAGLAAGDRVVVSANGELVDGRPLTAVERPQ